MTALAIGCRDPSTGGLVAQAAAVLDDDRDGDPGLRRPVRSR